MQGWVLSDFYTFLFLFFLHSFWHLFLLTFLFNETNFVYSFRLSFCSILTLSGFLNMLATDFPSTIIDVSISLVVNSWSFTWKYPNQNNFTLFTGLLSIIFCIFRSFTFSFPFYFIAFFDDEHVTLKTLIVFLIFKHLITG